MKVKNNISVDKILQFFLIATGTVTWSLTMIKSGLVYDYGVGFWGPNGHDGVWHISLAESLSKGTLAMPVFFGESIKNYHIGFDIFLALIHKITTIPIANLYFQVLPVIFAVSIGYFTYRFVYIWRKSYLQAWWATFFMYFGSGWGYLVGLFRNGELGGESLFWSQQSISTLVNPPYALSLVILLLGMSWMLNVLEFRKKKILLLAILFSLLVQIKIYAAVLVIASLFITSIWIFIRQRSIKFFILTILTFIFSYLLFVPLTSNPQDSLVVKPFWFLESMLVSTDRFYWPKLGEAMVNYRLAENWPKAALAYTLAFLIFWFGNLGTRVVKEILVFRWIKNITEIHYIEVFISSTIVFGVLIPMIFVQAGNPWNTIQFMYYSLAFSGILAGVVIGNIIEKLKNNFYKLGVYAILVLSAVLPTYSTLKHYIPDRPPAMISKSEIEALQFLKKLPNGVVLTLPYDTEASSKAVNNPPRPLYLYESTAYVSAYSSKPVYLEEEVNLEITGYKWRDRRDRIIEAYSSSAKMDELVGTQSIKYIYYVKDIRLGNKHLIPKYDKLFENSEVAIYLSSK